MIRFVVVVAIVMLLPFGGCIDPPPTNYGPVQADVIVEQEGDFDSLWETTLRVLRQANLRPDRQDQRDGVITTFPITCQQWFEFWRHDAMGPYQFLESSMHTIQRQAVIRIQRRTEAGRYRVVVRVDVFRQTVPERQVTSPAAAIAMYSAKMPTEKGEQVAPGEAMRWVPLGRDPRMEGALLRRILVHYGGTYELIQEPDESIEEIVGTQPAVESQPAGSRPVATAPKQ
jgi:hypothetical protein